MSVINQILCHCRANPGVKFDLYFSVDRVILKPTELSDYYFREIKSHFEVLTAKSIYYYKRKFFSFSGIITIYGAPLKFEGINSKGFPIITCNKRRVIPPPSIVAELLPTELVYHRDIVYRGKTIPVYTYKGKIIRGNSKLPVHPLISRYNIRYKGGIYLAGDYEFSKIKNLWEYLRAMGETVSKETRKIIRSEVEKSYLQK